MDEKSELPEGDTNTAEDSFLNLHYLQHKNWYRDDNARDINEVIEKLSQFQKLLPKEAIDGQHELASRIWQKITDERETNLRDTKYMGNPNNITPARFAYLSEEALSELTQEDSSLSYLLLNVHTPTIAALVGSGGVGGGRKFGNEVNFHLHDACPPKASYEDVQQRTYMPISTRVTIERNSKRK